MSQGTQPQGDMGRLHGFLDNPGQVLAQALQVHLMAQRGVESIQGSGCVIFAAIEAAVNQCLEAPAQRLEESCDGEGRGHNHNGVLPNLVRKQAGQWSQTDHQTRIDQSQRSRQRAVDQRAVDQGVDIVEAVARDRKTNPEASRQK